MSNLFIRGIFFLHLRWQLRHRYCHIIFAIKNDDLDISRGCCCVKPVLPFPKVYTFARYVLRALKLMQRSYGP